MAKTLHKELNKKPCIKISDTYDPAQWRYRKEVRPDGYTTIYFDNGGIVECPPFPDDEQWHERVSKRMCEINYQILARLAAEKRVKEEL